MTGEVRGRGAAEARAGVGASCPPGVAESAARTSVPLLRDAAAADAPTIYDLVCDMERTEMPREAFLEILRSQLVDASHHRVLVAERAGKVVGVLHLRMEPQLHHTGLVAEVMELAVAEGARNHGVGARLLHAAEDVARQRGCLQIEVACNQLRHRAHAFYEREGLHNFHYKFSRPLTGEDSPENALGH